MEFFNINNVFILPYIAIIKKTEFQEKFFSPFPIKRKDVLFLPNPTIASRQMGVKDPFLATFPISLVHQERTSTVKPCLSQETKRNFVWNTLYRN